MNSKKLTINTLRQLCTELGRKPPSGYKKGQLIQLYEGLIQMGATKNNPLPEYISCNRSYTPRWKDDKLSYEDHLNKYGWCVIPITTMDPDVIRDMFFDWIEQSSPEFNRFDPNTYKNIPMNIKGIFKGLIGQSKLMWTVREGCYSAYADLLKDDDLVTSLDGACLLSKRDRLEQWIHSDTFRDLNGTNHQYTYQGFYNILDCDEISGGLLVLEGSHLIYNEYLRTHPIDCINSYSRVDTTDPLLANLPLVKVCCNKGELVVWDGRTFHCNTPPIVESRLRMCCYVAMQPRWLLTDEDIRLRREYYSTGRQTGHWCYKPGLSTDSIRHYGRELPEIEIAELNPYQLWLLG